MIGGGLTKVNEIFWLAEFQILYTFMQRSRELTNSLFWI